MIRERGITVFSHLFGCFKVALVGKVVIKFAVVRRIVAANLWSSFVDAAPVVILKMLASGVDQQVPDIVFDENGGAVMQQIPSQIFKIRKICRFLDGKCKITAAFCGAMIAK